MSEQEQVNQFMTRCRAHRLNVTPQRLAIFKAVIGDKSHPNPEAVFSKIKRENPTISLATVYKTLETFQRNSIISLVTNLHDTLRYDARTDLHHHMICNVCKKVIDVYDNDLNRLAIPKSVTGNHKLLSFGVHFDIICSECSSKN